MLTSVCAYLQTDEASRQVLTFSLASCTHLNSVRLSIEFEFGDNNNLALVNNRQNTWVWEPLITSICHAPDSLSTIVVTILFYLDDIEHFYLDDIEHASSSHILLPTLHAINWVLLDQALQSHPNITRVAVCLPQWAPTDVLVGLTALLRKDMSSQAQDIIQILRLSDSGAYGVVFD